MLAASTSVFQIVVVIDFHDVTDKFQTVLSDVIESPDERADVGGARFRGQDCLRS
jgi:hypothetical protein